MANPEGSEFLGIISWVLVASALIALLALAGVYGCASGGWNGGWPSYLSQGSTSNDTSVHQ